MKMPEAFEAIIRWHFVEKGKNTFCIEPEEVCPLVRCKDCKHYLTHIPCVGGEYDGCDVWLDNGNEIEVKPDDFCSYAERRTDG